MHEQALRIPTAQTRASSTTASSHVQAVLTKTRRVLLVRLRSLGDAVLMTPVPRALKAWRPDLHVSVLLEEPLGAIFRHHPAVDEVISVPPHDTAGHRLRWIAEIRRKRFDVVFNMHSGSTAGLYTTLSGASVRLAYARARFASACNVVVPSSRLFWDAERVHTVKHQLSPLLHLGIPVPRDIELELHLDPSAVRRVSEDRQARGLQRGGFTVLHSFTKMHTKEWDPARFAALAKALAVQYGKPVLAIAAPSERPKLERLLALEPEIVGLPGLTLEEMMAWIDQCGLFVGNDSGPLHVAAALRKKIVAIWGSSDPRVWHPWTAEHQLLAADLPCIPCAGYRCDEYETPRCIESISVAQAVEAVARLKPF